MNDIRNTFITKTIPDFLGWEFDMTYIKFIFDPKDLKELENHLNEKEESSYYLGLKSIDYLCGIRKNYNEGKENIYIPIHDADYFFSLLQQIIEAYEKKERRILRHSENFIRSIWLRMGPNDIQHVEEFLERQLSFLKNESVLKSDDKQLNNEEILSYQIHENSDWFETNQNIVFSIRKMSNNAYEGTIDYEFPSIHFALTKENEKPICYIYGIQSIFGYHNEQIKEKLQPIKKELRNKYVSADFESLNKFACFLCETNAYRFYTYSGNKLCICLKEGWGSRLMHVCLDLTCSVEFFKRLVCKHQILSSVSTLFLPQYLSKEEFKICIRS